ncbi:hypothetical protein HY994_02640 [Candidatus Micrarchaeota archaeon]|nr:hypothetical protein [Candidatus Micrarchaeota archaeon]
MRLSYLVVGAVLILVAIVASASSAFSFRLSEDAVFTHGTEAQVYAYADQTAAFSTLSQYANVRVENFGDHALIHLLAPDCLQGTETIIIRATNGTVTLSKTISLTNLPSRSCPAYIQPTPQINAFYIPSSLTFSHTFDATHYDLQMDTDSACTPVTVGQTHIMRIRLQNDGAALSVTLRPMDEDGGATHTYLSRSQFSLDRNELESAIAYVRALKSGTHFVTIEALRGDIVVGRTSACIQVTDVMTASLVVPARTDALACQLTPISVQLTNDGTAQQRFTIQGNGINPVALVVPAGQTVQTTVQLNASQLRPNENVVAIRAQGDQTAGTAYVVVNVLPCGAQVFTTAVSIQPELLAWTIRVQNDQDTPLRNVTLWVSGIPASWGQVSDSADISPHSSKDLAVRVTRTTDEAANPVIHVLADGKEIAQHSVGAIAQGPGITGRVISAFAGNWLWIFAALLLVLAAVLFFRARDNNLDAAENTPPTDTGSTDDNTDAYKEKVRSVKVKVEQSGTESTNTNGNGSNGKKQNGH